MAGHKSRKNIEVNEQPKRLPFIEFERRISRGKLEALNWFGDYPEEAINYIDAYLSEYKTEEDIRVEDAIARMKPLFEQYYQIREEAKQGDVEQILEKRNKIDQAIFKIIDEARVEADYPRTVEELTMDKGKMYRNRKEEKKSELLDKAIAEEMHKEDITEEQPSVDETATENVSYLESIKNPATLTLSDFVNSLKSAEGRKAMLEEVDTPITRINQLLKEKELQEREDILALEKNNGPLSGIRWELYESHIDEIRKDINLVEKGVPVYDTVAMVQHTRFQEFFMHTDEILRILNAYQPEKKDEDKSEEKIESEPEKESEALVENKEEKTPEVSKEQLSTEPVSEDEVSEPVEIVDDEKLKEIPAEEEVLEENDDEETEQNVEEIPSQQYKEGQRVTISRADGSRTQGVISKFNTQEDSVTVTPFYKADGDSITIPMQTLEALNPDVETFDRRTAEPRDRFDDYYLNQEVLIPRTDGSSNKAKIIAFLEGSKVHVTWQEDNQVLFKTVPLERVDALTKAAADQSEELPVKSELENDTEELGENNEEESVEVPPVEDVESGPDEEVVVDGDELPDVEDEPEDAKEQEVEFDKKTEENSAPAVSEEEKEVGETGSEEELVVEVGPFGSLEEVVDTDAYKKSFEELKNLDEGEEKDLAIKNLYKEVRGKSLESKKRWQELEKQYLEKSKEYYETEQAKGLFQKGNESARAFLGIDSKTSKEIDDLKYWRDRTEKEYRGYLEDSVVIRAEDQGDRHLKIFGLENQNLREAAGERFLEALNKRKEIQETVFVESELKEKISKFAEKLNKYKWLRRAGTVATFAGIGAFTGGIGGFFAAGGSRALGMTTGIGAGALAGRKTRAMFEDNIKDKEKRRSKEAEKMVSEFSFRSDDVATIEKQDSSIRGTKKVSKVAEATAGAAAGILAGGGVASIADAIENADQVAESSVDTTGRVLESGGVIGKDGFLYVDGKDALNSFKQEPPLEQEMAADSSVAEIAQKMDEQMAEYGDEIQEEEIESVSEVMQESVGSKVTETLTVPESVIEPAVMEASSEVPETSVETTEVAETSKDIYVVQKGDNLWKILEGSSEGREISEALAKLPNKEIREDALEDLFKRVDSSEELREEIGMRGKSSGQIYWDIDGKGNGEQINISVLERELQAIIDEKGYMSAGTITEPEPEITSKAVPEVEEKEAAASTERKEWDESDITRPISPADPYPESDVEKAEASADTEVKEEVTLDDMDSNVVDEPFVLPEAANDASIEEGGLVEVARTQESGPGQQFQNMTTEQAKDAFVETYFPEPKGFLSFLMPSSNPVDLLEKTTMGAISEMDAASANLSQAEWDTFVKMLTKMDETTAVTGEEQTLGDYLAAHADNLRSLPAANDDVFEQQRVA